MRRPLLLFLSFMALVVGALASCEDAQTYVYSAQKYDPMGNCVNDYTSVEIVNGSGASSKCKPICLTVGSDLYVSTMCPPLPAIATEAQADAGNCIAAVAAQASGRTCDIPVDAGEEEAGNDGGAEAAADASDEGGERDAGEDAPMDSGIKDASDAG
jgi:hypothetical protein